MVVGRGDSMSSAPFRILSEGPLAGDTSEITPSADERHHLLKVRRAEPGQAIEVLDGAGRIAIGTLRRDGSVTVERVEVVTKPTDLVLLVGAGDRDRFLWLVEKCVEVGVSRLVPVETERSRQVASRVRAEHRDKLERRAREALKQCGGAWNLDVAAVIPLEQALSQVESARRWLADPRGMPPDLTGPPTSVTVAIGPEGGFTTGETGDLEGAGFRFTRLGIRTLRFETAALAAAMIVRLEGSERDE